MKLKIYLFLGQCFCNLFMSSNCAALIGDNVRTAENGQFPYVSSIGRLDQNGTRYTHFCTGSLISNRDIITAAHCMDDENLNNVRIVVGSNDITTGAKSELVFWLYFDHWAESNQIRLEQPSNDVCMIRLLHNISAAIEPALLTDLPDRFFYDCDVKLAGWGVIRNRTSPTLLQTGDVKLISIPTCKKRVNQMLNKTINFQSRLFCTIADPDIFIFMGDSGGPVLFTNVVVGINLKMGPYLNCEPGNVNIHTGIYYYKNFILDFIDNI